MTDIEKIEYYVDKAAGEPGFELGLTRRQMRKAFSTIALALCLGLLVSQLLIPGLLVIIVPEMDIKAHTFLVGGLCTALFTLPAAILLTTGLSRQQPEKNELTAGRFFALVAICYACMILGNIVGIGVNYLLSPDSVDLIGKLATASGASPAEMIIAFVILAPVFEEMVFRKVLVDRVLPYGEWPAILFSGITFGLFHGNLAQFFYAALLGMVLAYVYIRTGRILYTIGIHACINFLGGVVPLLIPSASSLFLLVALAGIVLFFVLRKDIRVSKDAVPGVGVAMFGNVGMILFLIITGLLMSYVAYIMNHPELTQGLI